MTKAEIQLQLRLEELDDIKAVASTAAGRRLLGRIFHQANIFTPLAPHDALVMSFNEGQRNVGLMIMNDLLQACPEKYISMQKAAKEREDRLRQQLEEAEEEETY